MPFGLCDAPAVFQSFINEILRDLLYSSVVIYLEYILIFSQDAHSHHLHVIEVLSRLKKNQLYCKLEKCSFEASSMPFLGYIISGSGLQMDPEKVRAILDWPRPATLKAVQRFLGFSNYYRQFIQGYSTIVAPITAFTKKGANTKDWTEEALEAFTFLKRAFSFAHILRQPNISQPFFFRSGRLCYWSRSSTRPEVSS
ncbi:uncharacterized protein LOC142150820 [Mixophyes fleayi]|uniref:uncharacterized protein LOC142150820 n=1 Tax=Mixophyes fleayi TaxID=3061075 RepID=UPI003F4D96BB